MKDGDTINKYKARLVIKGYRQREGLDYFDTYSPVTRITCIRLLVALVAVYDLESHQMDVKMAFLNGDLEEEIYIEQPEGFVVPDIACAISQLSRYMSNLGQSHWMAMKRVLGYLELTQDFALHYSKYLAVIEGYCDANWITGSTDSKSSSGYVFTIGEGVVSLKSSKQTCIARSTMEAEFIALDKAGEEAE
ncbi:secreted RxLR effector protein 161-like [Nicotiana tomentosiformis]|uniref:secreted RxLR effector protein 161-like n=1 Tax=Nicotiana tomentosiformis TaxID=4098 RepID=UPI00388CBD00